MNKPILYLLEDVEGVFQSETKRQARFPSLYPA